MSSCWQLDIGWSILAGSPVSPRFYSASKAVWTLLLSLSATRWLSLLPVSRRFQLTGRCASIISPGVCDGFGVPQQISWCHSSCILPAALSWKLSSLLLELDWTKLFGNNPQCETLKCNALKSFYLFYFFFFEKISPQITYFKGLFPSFVQVSNKRRIKGFLVRQVKEKNLLLIYSSKKVYIAKKMWFCTAASRIYLIRSIHLQMCVSLYDGVR